MQWLIVILLIAGIYYFVIRKPSLKNPKQPSEEIMLECEKCGTYISSKEAIIKEGAYYCSKECALGEK